MLLICISTRCTSLCAYIHGRHICPRKVNRMASSRTLNAQPNIHPIPQSFTPEQAIGYHIGMMWVRGHWKKMKFRKSKLYEMRPRVACPPLPPRMYVCMHYRSHLPNPSLSSPTLQHILHISLISCCEFAFIRNVHHCRYTIAKSALGRANG